MISGFFCSYLALAAAFDVFASKAGAFLKKHAVPVLQTKEGRSLEAKT